MSSWQMLQRYWLLHVTCLSAHCNEGRVTQVFDFPIL